MKWKTVGAMGVAAFVTTLGLSAQGQDVAASATTASAGETTFRLVDARSPKDRKKFSLSYSITNCNYGIWNLGDEEVPGRIERLDAQLKAELGQRLVGHEIDVERYSIFINGQSGLRSIAGAAAMGSVGLSAPIAPRYAGSSCSPEKMKGGWFDGAEISSDEAPYIVEITVRLDGKLFSARAAVSPDPIPRQPSMWGRKDALKTPQELAAFDKVTTKANAALIVQLSDQLLLAPQN